RLGGQGDEQLGQRHGDLVGIAPDGAGETFVAQRQDVVAAERANGSGDLADLHLAQGVVEFLVELAVLDPAHDPADRRRRALRELAREHAEIGALVDLLEDALRALPDRFLLLRRVDREEYLADRVAGLAGVGPGALDRLAHLLVGDLDPGPDALLDHLAPGDAGADLLEDRRRFDAARSQELLEAARRYVVAALDLGHRGVKLFVADLDVEPLRFLQFQPFVDQAAQNLRR